MGSCTQRICRSYIAALNTLVLFVGLAMLAISIYVIVEQNKQGLLSSAGALWYVWVPFGFSLALVIIALVGCCTVIDDNKCCIGFYGFIQFIFGIIIIVSGVALILVIDEQESIANTAENPSALDPGFFGTAQLLQSFEFGAMQSCCPSTDQTPFLLCKDVAIGVCVWDQEAYQAGLDVNDTAGACDGFQALGFCPDTNAALTQSQQVQLTTNTIFRYMTNTFRPAGIAFCVFGGILFLAFIGSSYLACCARSPQQRQQQAQSAQRTAGTGGPQTRAMAMA